MLFLGHILGRMQKNWESAFDFTAFGRHGDYPPAWEFSEVCTHFDLAFVTSGIGGLSPTVSSEPQILGPNSNQILLSPPGP